MCGVEEVLCLLSKSCLVCKVSVYKVSGVKNYGVKGVWCKRHLVHKVLGVIAVFVRKTSGIKVFGVEVALL